MGSSCCSARKSDVVGVAAPTTPVAPPTNTKQQQQQQPQPQEAAMSTKPLDSLEDVNVMLSKDPLVLFQDWFERAQYTDGIRLATSASLATANKTVGVKGFDKEGFKVATNSNSRKAKDMDENAYASLLFYWEPLNRMVRVDGPTTRLSAEATAAIWRGFSHAAQLLHSASRQDDVIVSSQEVKDRRTALASKYPETVSLPPNPVWCSYNLAPDRWEFYQAMRRHRLVPGTSHTDINKPL